MSIDEATFDEQSTLAIPLIPESTLQLSSTDSVLHEVAIQAFRVGSYLTEPACKVHELYRRISIVEGSTLEQFVEKVSICLMMGGWFAVSLVATLPGMALRYLGQCLQRDPYIHRREDGPAKTLPPDRRFSMLSWNICGINAGYSITDAGVTHWRYRIDNILSKIVEKNADVNCLMEVFDINTAYYVYEKLKVEGYRDFYFNISHNPLGISSGIFIASKYDIEKPEFTRFPVETLIGPIKSFVKGVFGFDLIDAHGVDLARLHVTHLQHSEQPEFPVDEEVAARSKQMQIVVDKVNQVKGKCAILTGDLNLDDEELENSFWHHHFERMDFGAERKTWGGDAFCSLIVDRVPASGPLNLDHTLLVPGTAHAVHNSLIETKFDGTLFNREALSDHEGLYSVFEI